MNKGLTYEEAKKLFSYDPETGDLTWRVNRRRVKKGCIAGSLNACGYMQTMVDGTLYYNHRIIWLWCKGYFPEHLIDHINRNRSDNRIENLRHVTYSCNLKNCGVRKGNTTGMKGVSWDKSSKRWKSHITNNGKASFLGNYKSFYNAVCARFAAEQCLGWSKCDFVSPAHKFVQKNIIRPRWKQAQISKKQPVQLELFKAS